MKRIIAVSTLAIAACVGFSSAASAQAVTGTSTHSGAVIAACSVTSNAPATFTQITTSINGVSFPTSLTSTGKFTTLCNTALNTTTVEKNATATVPTGQPAPAITFDLSATGTSAYVGNGILGTNLVFATAVPTSAAVAHGYSTTPSDLDVAVKVAAQSGKILQDGTYTVVLKATVTP